RLKVFLISLVPLPVFGQLPPVVTLEDVLRIVGESPRVAVSQREAEAARAEREAAAAFANPSLSVGRSRPAGGDRTIFDARSQDQRSGVRAPKARSNCPGEPKEIYKS